MKERILQISLKSYPDRIVATLDKRQVFEQYLPEVSFEEAVVMVIEALDLPLQYLTVKAFGRPYLKAEIAALMET